MAEKRVYFISGIDTDAGKSIATGVIAHRYLDQGVKVITQKLIQTGCAGISEDIELHRRLMKTGLMPEDLDGTTSPLCFSYPASPDLAARLEGKTVDLAIADRSTEKLLAAYDVILIEGAGGLLVPINGFYTMLDYVKERNIPLILVTNPKLGSINHTLLSLEACRNHGIKVDTLVYNLYPETSPEITDDTRNFMKSYLDKFMPDCRFTEIPFINI